MLQHNAVLARTATPPITKQHKQHDIQEYKILIPDWLNKEFTPVINQFQGYSLLMLYTPETSNFLSTSHSVIDMIEKIRI